MIYYSRSNIGGTAMKKDGAGALKGTTLDAFEFSEDRVDFVKIDAEGFEERVIIGGVAFLRKYHPKFIFIEIWTSQSAEPMLKRLTPLGYRHEQRIDFNYLYVYDQLNVSVE
jgi:hypothetical protein